MQRYRNSDSSGKFSATRTARLPEPIARLLTTKSAFSRVDLIVVLALAALLAAWTVFSHIGERSRIARCAANLKALGQAMHSDANDHSDGIPPAAIALDKTRVNWAMDLPPYLKSGQAPAKSAYDKLMQLENVSRWFVCPSDPGQRGQHPCSYAMPERNMSYGWPPASDDKTGVGLRWDKNSVPALLGSELLQSATERPESLPRLNLSIVTAPADTLLLTEFIASNNILGSLPCAQVRNIKAQQSVYKSDSSHFHFGGFNYLMADDHVEWLRGLQTGEIGMTPAGVWTINPRD